MSIQPEALRRTIAAALAVAAALASPVAAELPDGVTWDRALWDPVPGEDGDDLILPMPCGGAMAFRRVATPVLTDVWLDDRPFDLGFEADEDLAYSEYLRTEYIAGSIVDRDERVFYIGKYEVTADQVAALAGDACPAPSMRGRVAATGLTWFEAIEIGRAYNEWLLQTAPDALPAAEDRRAFLRLPTEAEWEFVARGGVRVSDQAFDDRLFPMADGGLSAYAWYQGPESAGGRFRPVGLLRPNPLGVYDLLGNVEEFLLEPFRMNRGGRFHGQRGGFVTKGGSIRTAGGSLRTAMRAEYSYFDERTGQATRLDTFGLRLLISAPIGTSIARVAAIREGWAEVSRLRDTSGLDPMAALDEVTETLDNALQRESLEAIRGRLNNELAAAEAEAADAEAALGDAERLARQAERERDSAAELARAAEAQVAELEARLAETGEAIAEVEAALRRELTLRNEAEGEALQALIYSGAFIMRKLRDDHRQLAAFERSLQGIEALLVQFPGDADFAAQREDLTLTVAARRRVFEITENAYFHVLRRTGRNYPEEVLGQALTLVAQGLDALYEGDAQARDGEAQEPRVRLSAFAALFVAQAARFGGGAGLDQATVLREILEL